MTLDKLEDQPQGTKVKFSYSGISGKGVIVGISSKLPIVNTIYIISTDYIFSDIYPYTNFTIPACYLELDK